MRLLTLRNILVATELDDVAVAAVVAGYQLAGAAGASLHAVSVAAPLDHHRAGIPGAPEAKVALAAILDRAGARADDVKIHILEGDPAPAIGSLAERLHA